VWTGLSHVDDGGVTVGAGGLTGMDQRECAGLVERAGPIEAQHAEVVGNQCGPDGQKANEAGAEEQRDANDVARVVETGHPTFLERRPNWLASPDCKRDATAEMAVHGAGRVRDGPTAAASPAATGFSPVDRPGRTIAEVRGDGFVGVTRYTGRRDSLTPDDPRFDRFPSKT
jgi:hypothetical protein